MFKTILLFELKDWLRNPLIYIYAGLLGLLSFVVYYAMAESASTSSSQIQLNAPFQLYRCITYLHFLILCLLPSIFGASAFRDFNTRVDAFLFSYPIHKRDYLAGKCCAALLVMIGLLCAQALGILIGAHVSHMFNFPIGNLDLNQLLYLYLLFIIPDFAGVGLLIFMAVYLTRNIFSAYLIIILLLMMQFLLDNLIPRIESPFWLTLLYPNSQASVFFHLNNWTVWELNHQRIPLEGSILAYRLFWSALIGIVSLGFYRHFQLSQERLSFQFGRNSRQKPIKQKPTAENSNTKAKQSLYWSEVSRIAFLSRFYFQLLLRDRVFILLTFLGSMGLLWLISESMNPMYGFRTLPVSWKMTRIPVFLFSGIIQLLIFLYAGKLIHQARINQMQLLISATPISNTSLLLARCLALVYITTLLLALDFAWANHYPAIEWFHAN